MNGSKEAYCEVDEFLNLIGKYYINKLPIKLREFFKNEKNTSYTFNINPDIPIAKQEFSEEALAIIAFLNLKYWCNDEEEKKRLNDIYIQNEKKYQNGLDSLKNNSTDLFEKTPDEIKVQKSNIVIYKKTSIFEKILSKIRSFFIKKS